jgi:hypothetical protein
VSDERALELVRIARKCLEGTVQPEVDVVEPCEEETFLRGYVCLLIEAEKD